MKEWLISETHYDSFYLSEYFNGYKYTCHVWVEAGGKSFKFWFGASSGKKRKELDIFEDKDNKSLGGLKALFWLKRCVLEFSDWYSPKYIRGAADNKKSKIICISWADAKRRDIYSRLEGFSFNIIDGNKVLTKKL